MVAVVVATAVLLIVAGVALRMWSKRQLSSVGDSALGTPRALDAIPQDGTNAAWSTETDRMRNSGY